MDTGLGGEFDESRTLSSRWALAPERACLSPELSCPWDAPGRNTGVGCHSLLQGIFLTQGSNPGLLHCRLALNHQSWRLSWVANRCKNSYYWFHYA